LFERTELLRRAALILTLAPGSGDQSASEESAEALVSRWRGIARSLRGRSDWRAPLASNGRFIAAALALQSDLRADVFGDAIEECLQRFGEVHLAGPRRARVIAAALLVCTGARSGDGIVPTFERVRGVAALVRERRSSGCAWRDGRDLSAAVLGPSDPELDLTASAEPRLHDAVRRLSPAPSGMLAEQLVYTLEWVSGTAPARATPARVARLSALIALQAV
jgi:hypothetical protein